MSDKEYSYRRQLCSKGHNYDPSRTTCESCQKIRKKLQADDTPDLAKLAGFDDPDKDDD